MADKMFHLIITERYRTAEAPFPVNCTARTSAGGCVLAEAFAKIGGVKKIKESRTEIHFEVTPAAKQHFDSLKKQKHSVICGGCRNK